MALLAMTSHSNLIKIASLRTSELANNFFSEYHRTLTYHGIGLRGALRDLLSSMFLFVEYDRLNDDRFGDGNSPYTANFHRASSGSTRSGERRRLLGLLDQRDPSTSSILDKRRQPSVNVS